MFKELIKDNKILVIGDFMLDSYWFGNVLRISPEAPVAVFQKKSMKSVTGGAANVAANLLSAGKNVMAASVIGNDSIGDKLVELLVDLGCDCSMLLRSENRKTTKKTRLLAQNNQQLLRVDEEEIIWLTKNEEEQLVNDIKQSINKISAIILSDYMKGILTETLCQKVIKMADDNGVPVYCDVKDSKTEKYKGAALLKPNKKELQILTGTSCESTEQVKNACKLLSNKCCTNYILVTLGSQGMALYTKDSDSYDYIQSEQREVYDVSGAGDTVISYLVACVSSGIRINEAVKYANKAAGIKVGKVGTSFVSLDEMEDDIRKEQMLKHFGIRKDSKVLSLPDLLKRLHNHKNKKIVFTNGCFDILHAGHVMYLQKASECGDMLIVGVNSNDSVKRLKGTSRPINDLSDRLAVLAGLESVTWLVAFDEETPENLIRAIKPDVLVKGSDYEGKFIAGAGYVQKNGGEVVLIPMHKGCSTTKIIDKYREG